MKAFLLILVVALLGFGAGVGACYLAMKSAPSPTPSDAATADGTAAALAAGTTAGIWMQNAHAPKWHLRHSDAAAAAARCTRTAKLSIVGLGPGSHRMWPGLRSVSS